MDQGVFFFDVVRVDNEHASTCLYDKMIFEYVPTNSRETKAASFPDLPDANGFSIVDNAHTAGHKCSVGAVRYVARDYPISSIYADDAVDLQWQDGIHAGNIIHRW
jgi:hypothetical protein